MDHIICLFNKQKNYLSNENEGFPVLTNFGALSFQRFVIFFAIHQSGLLIIIIIIHWIDSATGTESVIFDFIERIFFFVPEQLHT